MSKATTHRALLAVPARVLSVLRLGALALAAHALAVPRAELAHVLAVLRHARLVRRAALARSVTCRGKEGKSSILHASELYCKNVPKGRGCEVLQRNSY